MSDDLDINEIWGLYAEEGGQSLDEVEACLLILQQTPNNSDAIARLFRAMHTYKGNARMLGLSVIESVAHQSEDMIGLVRDDGVALDNQIIDLLFEATDCLRGMLELSVANHHDAPQHLATDMCQRLTDKIAACRLAKTEKVADLPVEDQPEAVLQESIIFEPLDNSALADDPVYREIFREIAEDNLRNMQTILANQQDLKSLSEEVEQLHYAAQQMGMQAWSSLLSNFLGFTEPDIETAQILLEALQALYAEDFPTASEAITATHTNSSSADDSIHDFFTQLQAPFNQLSQLSQALGEPHSLEAIVTAASKIISLAEPHGFVRLIEVLDQLIVEIGRDDGLIATYYPDFEFKLYRELAAIADLLADDAQPLAINPCHSLRQWCAEHLFDNLLDMRLVMERLNRQENPPIQCQRMIVLLHQVYHACLHYGMDTAAHLSMSMLDLYSRAETGELVVDAMLLHITKSFISDVEIVLDSAELGEMPDMAQLKQLLQDTSEVTFASNGTLSSAQIEARLGLPKSFHKVLTPESIKTVVNALEQGRCFYIIRADLNHDEELAGEFINWISTGAGEVISNVTVFEGAETLYDFFIASRLSEEAIYEALSLLDPQSQQLRLEAVLHDRHSQHQHAQSGHQQDATQTITTQSILSSEILEVIGELVTGQSMVQHMLNQLIETDLPYSVDAIVHDAGQQWPLAKGPVKQALEAWQGQLEQLIQLETHHTALLNRLQDEAISLRVRPAALLLKPLQPFCETLARQSNRQVSLITSGDEIELDFSMVDQLKAPLRSLLQILIHHSIELPEQRLAVGKAEVAVIKMQLLRYDDHIKLSLSDDGIGLNHISDQQGVAQQLNEIRQQLQIQGGNLHVSNAAGFQISLPLAMVAVEGMVVRVDAVKYVIPIQGIQTIIRADAKHMMQVSADGGQPMLRLSTEDVIPIQLLAGRHDQQSFRYPTQLGLYVIVRGDKQRLAIVVDELIGQQHVLIRPLQGYLSSIRGVTGCALLASGEVGLLLDISHLLGLKSP
jgi:two-component system chemotaxis sensor kinase CheA